MKYFPFLLFALFIFSCDSNETAPNNSEDKKEAQTANDKPSKGETKLSDGKLTEETNSSGTVAPISTQSKSAQQPGIYQEKLSDGTVTFDVMCRNGETSKFQVIGSGFEEDNVKFNGAVEGQLTESHLLDLNNDGFCELYMVFTETDDSENQLIKGYTSYRNKSAGEIYVKDTDMTRNMRTDKIFVENKKLIRSLKDENGNEIQFQYRLTKGETSFILEPVKL